MGDLSRTLREMQEQNRRRREADAPDRALRLSPDITERWTAVLRDASTLVAPGRRPCDTAPWIAAIHEAGLRHGFAPHPDDLVPKTTIASRLRNFIEDAALPAWPDPRPDLIEFALTVLETDVMLFRSGYAKRHLATRLRHAPLTDADIARLDAVLRRAVTRGTGLEEYRGYAKLAAHLVATGRLPDLPDWLATRAEGAILTLDIADGHLWRHIASLPESDLDALSRGGILRAYRHGLAWPDLTTVVPAGKAVTTTDQRIRRNAWRMLDQILRRVPAALDHPNGQG